VLINEKVDINRLKLNINKIDLIIFKATL